MSTHRTFQRSINFTYIWSHPSKNHDVMSCFLRFRFPPVHGLACSIRFRRFSLRKMIEHIMTYLYHWIGGKIFTRRPCFLPWNLRGSYGISGINQSCQNPRLKRHPVSSTANFDPNSCWWMFKPPRILQKSPNPLGLEHFVGSITLIYGGFLEWGVPP